MDLRSSNGSSGPCDCPSCLGHGPVEALQCLLQHQVYSRDILGVAVVMAGILPGNDNELLVGTNTTTITPHDLQATRASKQARKAGFTWTKFDLWQIQVSRRIPSGTEPVAHESMSHFVWKNKRSCSLMLSTEPRQLLHTCA